MKNTITKSEAKAFRTRWEIVNDAEIEELRKTSMTEKFSQLVALMSSVEKIGWAKSMASEEKEVRDRWIRLRKYYHA